MSAPNTYTFVQKTELTEPGAESNFGGLVNDANHNALTGYSGNGPQTVDISASPVTSPATVSNSSVTTLTTPLNAMDLNLLCTTNTVNISEADATVQSKYFTVPTGTQITIPVARVKALYLEANSGNSTVSFWYSIV